MSDPVTYSAVLPVADETVLFVSGLLAAERRRRGTRRGRRALGCYRQAVLILRWFLDGTRLAQLAGDNAISASTAYRYLHEGIDVLAAAAPGLRGALLAARAAGHTHVQVDGTLIRQARGSWRQHPGRHRPGRLAAVGLGRAAGTRARHQRAARPCRGAADS